MEGHRIEAQPRAGRGKGPARQLRREGKVPAVLYGNGIGSVALAVTPDSLAAVAKSPLGWNTPITLEVDGARHLAMIAEVQRHPVSRQVLHADFRAIREDEEVAVSVPLRVEGRSKGEQAGGKLQLLARRIKVRCMPSRIPEAVVLDVTELDIEIGRAHV